MSRYTTMLRYIVENTYENNVGPYIGKTPEELCHGAAPYIFNFSFNIWNESDKLNFQTDFLMKYYMREIALETVGLWKLYLRNWLRTNMPYWNMKMAGFLRGNDLESFMKNPNSFTDIYTAAEDSTDNGSGENGGMSKYYEVPSRDVVNLTDHLNNATQVNNTNSYDNSGHRSTNHTLTHTTEATPNTIKIWSEYKKELENTYNQLLDAMNVLFMGIY